MVYKFNIIIKYIFVFERTINGKEGYIYPAAPTSLFGSRSYMLLRGAYIIMSLFFFIC